LNVSQLTPLEQPGIAKELTMADRGGDPKLISWVDLKDELGFTAAERDEIRAGAEDLIAQARARRQAGVRTLPETVRKLNLAVRAIGK
jgi:hypothetical protein